MNAPQLFIIICADASLFVFVEDQVPNHKGRACQ